jgi:hypothetical protein
MTHFTATYFWTLIAQGGRFFALDGYWPVELCGVKRWKNSQLFSANVGLNFLKNLKNCLNKNT